MAPRLLAAMGIQRERYSSAQELQAFSGIAPVMEQSGKSKSVHSRWRCPKFLRQSFHEWAGHSIRFCPWARAFYQQQRTRGKRHHAATRSLAFKWMRILFRCWQDRVPLVKVGFMPLPLGELSQEGWHFLCRMGCSCNRSYRAGLIPVSISWPRLVLRTFCVAPAGASPVFGTLPNTVHLRKMNLFD